MMGIVDGSIPVADCRDSRSLGTVGTVTQAVFEGYKADQKCMISILAQKIEGGGYTTGLCTFTTGGVSFVLRTVIST